MMLKDSIEESIIALESSILEHEEILAQDVKVLKDMRTLKMLYTREEVFSNTIRIVAGTISIYDISTLDIMLNEIITAIDKLEEEYI